MATAPVNQDSKRIWLYARTQVGLEASCKGHLRAAFLWLIITGASRLCSLISMRLIRLAPAIGDQHAFLAPSVTGNYLHNPAPHPLTGWSMGPSARLADTTP